jgi:hypothetical protein
MEANERQRVSHASGAGQGAPASERVGGPGGANPPGLSMTLTRTQQVGLLLALTVLSLYALAHVWAG